MKRAIALLSQALHAAFSSLGYVVLAALAAPAFCLLVGIAGAVLGIEAAIMYLHPVAWLFAYCMAGFCLVVFAIPLFLVLEALGYQRVYVYTIAGLAVCVVTMPPGWNSGLWNAIWMLPYYGSAAAVATCFGSCVVDQQPWFDEPALTDGAER